MQNLYVNVAYNMKYIEYRKMDARKYEGRLKRLVLDIG